MTHTAEPQLQDMQLEDLKELIQLCRSITFDSLTERAQTTARHSVLDWVGCALQGAQQPGAEQFAARIEPSYGRFTVVGQQHRTTWRDAVLLNGVNGHILDFDDMLPSFSGHPTAAIMPTSLFMAEKLEKTLEDVLTSLVVGTEVGTWVASQVLPDHYDNGWHATGTIGTFGAAAAGAFLLELEPDEWVAALDIAATQSAGLKAVFGSIAKPLHAGKAAEAGALAVLMAPETALTGSALLGPNGFFKNYGPNVCQFIPRPASSTWALEGVLYKTYASCFMTQASVDAGIAFKEEAFSGLSHEDVQSIEIEASPQLADVCAIPFPKTPNQAKFSLTGTFVLGALGKDLSKESSFEVENLEADDFQQLNNKAEVIFADELAGSEPRIRVTVSLIDGQTWTKEIDRGEPTADLAQQEQKITEKFNSLAQRTLAQSNSERIAREILNTSPKISALLLQTRGL